MYKANKGVVVVKWKLRVHGEEQNGKNFRHCSSHFVLHFGVIALHFKEQKNK